MVRIMGNCNWRYVTSSGGGKIAVSRKTGFIREEGGSDGGGANERNTGIKILQDTVANSRTNELLGAYNELKDKSLREMTNEEKMVRAVLTDELAARGEILYDPKTGNYDKARDSKKIVYDNEKSYRIDDIITVKDEDGTRKYADAYWYYNGKFSKVKNLAIQKRLAQKYEEKKKSR